MYLLFANITLNLEVSSRLTIHRLVKAFHYFIIVLLNNIYYAIYNNTVPQPIELHL